MHLSALCRFDVTVKFLHVRLSLVGVRSPMEVTEEPPWEVGEGIV